MMVLALMARCSMEIVDYTGAFLREEFEDGADPEGFEKI